MHKDINQVVRENYHRYQSIGDRLKTLAPGNIMLHEKQNHGRCQVGDAALTFDGNDESGRLCVFLNVEKTQSRDAGMLQVVMNGWPNIGIKSYSFGDITGMVSMETLFAA